MGVDLHFSMPVDPASYQSPSPETRVECSNSADREEPRILDAIIDDDPVRVVEAMGLEGHVDMLIFDERNKLSRELRGGVTGAISLHSWDRANACIFTSIWDAGGIGTATPEWWELTMHAREGGWT